MASEQIGKIDAATAHYDAAFRALPDLRPLAVEYARFLRRHDPQGCQHLFARLPPSLRNDPRLRLIRALASLDLGDPAPAWELLKESPIVADLREGEDIYEELRHRYAETTGQEPPAGDQVDFRMFGD